MRIGTVSSGTIRQALNGPGLVIDLGAMVIRIRSTMPGLTEPLQRVYRHFPFVSDPEAFVDVDARLTRSPGLLRRMRPSLRFLADGLDPFGALPAEMDLAQLEWGINWCFATMTNRHLMLHAGTVEIGGSGLLLIGVPGAGKSTLSAALALRGARLLSDEFGVVRVADRALLPLPKPVALKNESIEVIGDWSPDAIIGPTYRKTHKGDVAHLAVPRDAVDARRSPVQPRAIVFPRWEADAETRIEPVGLTEAFSLIAFNSFNFDVLGPDAFDAVRDLVESCRCVRLRYSRLAEAVPALNHLVA